VRGAAAYQREDVGDGRGTLEWTRDAGDGRPPSLPMAAPPSSPPWLRRRQSPVMLRYAWGVFHEVGGSVSIPRGMDGDRGVWAGVGSASGLTERGVIDGPGLNPACADPREFTGIGLSSPPGRG
jgi:hypothetical protein